MNEARIADAAAQIAKRRVALAWLEQHGAQLTGRDDAAQVGVNLNHASGCAGAGEAAEVLSAYARLNLPEIVKHAMECCRNDIDIAIAAIREEIDRP